MDSFPSEASRWFASDNHAQVHPKIMQAIADANGGHAYAYGDDPWTKKAQSLFKKVFGAKSESFFVFNGTAANVLSLHTLVKSYEAVVCVEGAHVSVDECGAFEALTGSKLLVASSADGKLKSEKLLPFMVRQGDQHFTQARALTITQTTEWGTVYSRDELKEIKKIKSKYGLFLHMDGARFANACVALNIEAREMLDLAGVDVLSFGGTKNGCLAAEAVVFTNSKYAENFKFIRKQGMQLSSKMRFLAAQFNAYLEDDLWLKNAEHSNAMAKKLCDGLSKIKGVDFIQTPQANALFIKVPQKWTEEILQKYYFYVWDSSQNILRIMTSWDTQIEEINGFLNAVRSCSTS